jgi:Domain of unknown function (DUF932)
MELFKAHQQWATRPADERFSSLRELYDATYAYAKVSTEREVPWATLRATTTGSDVQVVGAAGNPARLTHWAFGQLANRVGAPAEYLRGLPAPLACDNLNHGLANRKAQVGDRASNTARLLFHVNGGVLCRALTSDRYARIWNHEVAERLLALESQGWGPARPTIRAIDDRLPLYASDHDMFVFLAHSELSIAEPGQDGALYRGVIVENSEVGAGALKLTRFLYREMCGNHIIWGAKDVEDLSLRHVGNVRDRMHRWSMVLKQYANASASGDRLMVSKAMETVIADTKEGVLDKLFGARSLGLSRKVLDSSYDAVMPAQDGSPNTVWGMAQGITRHSQSLPHADRRTELDRAAGKLLEFSF